jgi:threonine synthase
MRFVSTRDRGSPVTLSRAILQGIAPDGGFYIPEHLPRVSADNFEPGADLASVATTMLRPFAENDALETSLHDNCRMAFDFPAPLVPLQDAPGPVTKTHIAINRAHI